jgi:hypothetical protein
MSLWESNWQQYASPGSFTPAPKPGATGWQQYAPGGSFTPAPTSSTAATAPTGGGTNWGQLGGLMGLANLGLAQMAQSNTATSFNQMQQTGGIFGDIDFGTNLLAQNKDIFEQKDAPRWAAKFQVNDPFYRQFQTRQALANPGLAGRYSAFVS